MRQCLCWHRPGNRIITQLENLKKEAAEVQKKMDETDTVMVEVEMVSQQYLPLSTSCSSMYFTLESLNQVPRPQTWPHHQELCLGPLPVPVLSAVFLGDIPIGAEQQSSPQGSYRPQQEAVHHHQRHIPGECPIPSCNDNCCRWCILE